MNVDIRGVTRRFGRHLAGRKTEKVQDEVPFTPRATA